MVEHCGGTVEQCWRNSGTAMVEQCWWNSKTVIVEQWNSDCVLEPRNSDGGTVWWNSGRVMLEQCGGKVW